MIQALKALHQKIKSQNPDMKVILVLRDTAKSQLIRMHALNGKTTDNIPAELKEFFKSLEPGMIDFAAQICCLDSLQKSDRLKEISSLTQIIVQLQENLYSSQQPTIPCKFTSSTFQKELVN